MQTVIIHIYNEDPFVAEIDQLPQAYATSIKVQNPRLRDGKPLAYLQRGVVEVLWPLHRINFIEVISEEKEMETDIEQEYDDE